MANCTGRSIWRSMGRSAGRTIPACDGTGKRISGASCGKDALGVMAEKALGSSGTGPPQARTCCRGWAVMGWLPTLACGTGADGVTELVVSFEGKPAIRLSGPELDVQPPSRRQPKRSAGTADERMKTRTQNNGEAF
nr:hypothetical protein [Rhizobium sp. AN73]